MQVKKIRETILKINGTPSVKRMINVCRKKTLRNVLGKLDQQVSILSYINKQVCKQLMWKHISLKLKATT